MLKPASSTTVWILALAGIGSFVALEFSAKTISAGTKKVLFLVFTVSLWVLGAALFVLLSSYLAWIAVALLWIRAAYTALFREATRDRDNEQSYMAVKVGLIAVLALFAGGHALSFFLQAGEG